jgi:hypothetical protein
MNVYILFNYVYISFMFLTTFMQWFPSVLYHAIVVDSQVYLSYKRHLSLLSWTWRYIMI